MSMENRTSSALFKRAEQLKRWEESETNRESTVPKEKLRKIKFSSGCVFLAACAAGDKEEVQRLLERGADIDTANVDGLTALHQACIDDNLDMVEFLVDHGADINRGDNEGWTPLHATASCGFNSIAKFLIENGANVAAVNNDGELPVDIAECDKMEEMLHQHINAKGIDCDEARSEEERMMLEDAKEWLNSNEVQEIPHPKTGATALHVAAAKGYIKVMSLLIQAGVDINAQDLDGWTPLHAAAHWGQRESCEILVENFCDMDLKNCVGQSSFDVADTDMLRVLEELKKKQASMQKDRGDINMLAQNRGASTPKRRSSVTRMSGTDKSNIINRDTSAERQLLDKTISEESNKDKRVNVEIETESERDDRSATTEDSEVVEDEDTSLSSESSESYDDFEINRGDTSLEEKKNRVNRDEPSRIPTVPEVTKQVPHPAPTSTPKPPLDNEESNVPAWRRSGSFRNRVGANGREEPTSKSSPIRVSDKDDSASKSISSPTKSRTNLEAPDVEVVLRRTKSFEHDTKFYTRYTELRDRIKANSWDLHDRNKVNSCPILHSHHVSALSAHSAARHQQAKEEPKVTTTAPEAIASVTPTTTTATTTTTTTVATTTSTTTTYTVPAKVPSSPTAITPMPANQVRSLVSENVNSTVSSSPSTPSTPTSPGASKLSPGNIFKNFFKSFVPPVRDEESETQRKAHAKRVRETRRSTQGVTLEEIKSAEQLVKKKQQQQLQQATQQLQQQDQQSSSPPIISAMVTATITTAPTTVNTMTTPSVPNTKDNKEEETFERRPSWRLRVDNDDRNKFQLEDARNKGNDATAYIRRPVGGVSTVRPTSAPVENSSDTTVTIALRRQAKPPDDKEQDKENDSRNAQATQAVIQRRRKAKRRSTGVVVMDMDELDPDKQEGSEIEDGSKVNNTESGGDRSGRSSRLGSASSGGGDTAANSHPETTARSLSTASENGELDYKKLYEESMLENERLREKLRKTEDDLLEARTKLDKLTSHSARNSMSETEKRERRAMERKLSEMEEELKQMEQLKSENQRLKDENGALIRVISKLSK